VKYSPEIHRVQVSGESSNCFFTL